MVLYVMTWDLPTHRENLRVYANKARNDWIPTVLSHAGVEEFRTFRNPMESTPQVMVTIEFASLDAWRAFVEGDGNRRIMRELRIVGASNITAQVWLPSNITPERAVHPTD
jgi:heme-degrading monooxygenase HmoA